MEIRHKRTGAVLLRTEPDGQGRISLQLANISGADLRAAFLAGADLQGANLTGADLTGADLTAADLQGALLGEARLCGANLQRANLQSADLTGATYDSDTRWPEDAAPEVLGAVVEVEAEDFLGAPGHVPAEAA